MNVLELLAGITGNFTTNDRPDRYEPGAPDLLGSFDVLLAGCKARLPCEAWLKEFSDMHTGYVFRILGMTCTLTQWCDDQPDGSHNYHGDFLKNDNFFLVGWHSVEENSEFSLRFEVRERALRRPVEADCDDNDGDDEAMDALYADAYASFDPELAREWHGRNDRLLELS